MEIARIVADIVDSMAWPFSVFGIVLFISLLFKSELVNLIGRMTSLEVPHVKVGFTIPRPEPADGPAAEPAAIDDRYQDTIQGNPEAAVIEAWIEVQRDMAEAMHLLSYSLPRNADPGAVIRALRSESLISDIDYGELMELLRIRNQVIHSQPVSVDVETAIEYITRAGIVRGALKERAGQREDMLAQADPRK